MELGCLLRKLRISHIDMKFKYIIISNTYDNKKYCSNKPLEMRISMTQILEFKDSCLLFPDNNVLQIKQKYTKYRLSRCNIDKNHFCKISFLKAIELN